MTHIAYECGFFDNGATIWVVEREHARRDFRQADAAVDAGEILAEHQELAIDNLHVDDALAELQRRFERIGQALLHAFAHNQAVDDDLDGVLLVLFEVNRIVDIVNFAVDAHAHIAFVTDVLEDFLVLALLAADDLRHQQQLRALWQRRNLVDHLINAPVRANSRRK